MKQAGRVVVMFLTLILGVTISPVSCIKLGNGQNPCPEITAFMEGKSKAFCDWCCQVQQTKAFWWLSRTMGVYAAYCLIIFIWTQASLNCAVGEATMLGEWATCGLVSGLDWFHEGFVAILTPYIAWLTERAAVFQQQLCPCGDLQALVDFVVPDIAHGTCELIEICAK